MVDYHSKWIYYKFVSEVNTDVVKSFMENIFKVEGYPSFLVTDSGVQFKSVATKQFLANEEVKHLSTALYSPQGNGLDEIANRLIKETIQLAMMANKDVVETV